MLLFWCKNDPDTNLDKIYITLFFWKMFISSVFSVVLCDFFLKHNNRLIQRVTSTHMETLQLKVQHSAVLVQVSNIYSTHVHFK